MNKHAKFAPSAAHRWIPCPGSIRLSESIEYEPSEYAMEGTILHEVTEKCLREKKDPNYFLGEKFYIDDDSFSITIDEEHVEAISACIDETKNLFREHGIKQGKIEQRVEIADDCFGTIDVLGYNQSVLVIIDFKFGRGKSVEAKGNAQQMLYAIGAMNYLSRRNIDIPPSVLQVILQPRIPPPKREWGTTPVELKTWYNKSVKTAMELAENGDAPCNPGEEQCQFCPANGVCTARADYLLGFAEDEFKPYVTDPGDDIKTAATLPVPETAIVKAIDVPSADKLTPQVAARLLSIQPQFDNFFKAVGKYALRSALDGVKIPGYKLVEGRSNRKWSMPDKDIESRLRQQLVNRDMKGGPFTEKLWTPAQAEKKLGKGSVDSWVTKPQGKTILVEENDTRPELDLSYESEFEEFASGAKTVTSNTPDIEVFKDESSIDDIMSDVEVTVDESRHEEILQGNGGVAPSKRTKKYQLMVMGMKGGVDLKEAADEFYGGEISQVKSGLRQLNSRDGYTIIFHDDGTFTVKE